MPRSRGALALLTVLLALSGCLSGAPTATDPTATPTPNTDCAYGLHVELANDDQRNRVDTTLAYGNLSEARQTEFDRALENGTYDLGDNLPETWSGPRIVEQGDEQYYAVAFTC